MSDVAVNYCTVA